jgi:hypothetical protein
MVRRAAAGGALACALAACGPPEPAKLPPEVPHPLASADPRVPGQGPTLGDEQASAIREMLTRVAKVRGLGVLTSVRGLTIDRPTVEKMIRAKTDKELPPEVLEHENEALVALGLVAPAYDTSKGMFELVGTSLTGFYEPVDKTMYLTTDVPAAEREETLAHELVHALQDQHYDLGPLFKYKPDDDERVAAGHALAEGDATSAALDIVRGDVMGISERVFAAMSRASIEAIAPDVPDVLRESLVAPYVDGYAFVQALRRRGGFAAVDAAWRAMPVTTEQVLHLEKYDAKEPAIDLPPPSLSRLAREKDGRVFEQVYTQVLGEQSLRIVLDQWADPDDAIRTAAGWGGDRYVLARGKDAAAGESALAWHLRFDTEKDAKEMADVLTAQAHGTCVARPDVGPFAWAQQKRDVALTMGPYLRTKGKAKSTGTCKEARAWVAAILAAAPK